MGQVGEGYTPQRLAELTAVDEQRLQTLTDIGVLTLREDGTYPPAAVDRVVLVNYASSRGISDEQIERFCREHSEVFASLLLTRTTDARALTFDELFQRVPSGAFDDEFLAALLEVVGPETDEPATEDDVAALEMVVEVLKLGFPAEALIQLIRVIAEAAGRVAEAENRVFHDYVHEQNRARGLTGRELFEATETLSQPMLTMAEPSLLYLHRRAMARAMREDFVRHLTEDSRPPMQRPGEAQTTVLFIDLAGFTPLTLTMGDAVAADVLSRFGSIVRGAVVHHHGRIVKQIGDAFMLVFDDPPCAVAFGVDICAAVSQQSHFPAVHIGAHHGLVLYRDGDYVGTTVNMAARVAGVSQAGQFVVTHALVDGAGDPPDVHFDPLPAVELKGIDAPTSLFEVRAARSRPQPRRDPVCGMQVDGTDAQTTVRHQDVSYGFCSQACADRFLADPSRYVTPSG